MNLLSDPTDAKNKNVYREETNNLSNNPQNLLMKEEWKTEEDYRR